MRKSNRIGTAICAAGLFFILFSCAKDPTEIERTPTSTFPLTEGSRWEYEGLWYTVPFNTPLLADTARKEIYRHIIGTDSQQGIDDLIVCDDTVITNRFGMIDTLINRQWLKLEDNKLKLFAYDEFPVGNDPNPEIYDFPRNILDFPLNAGKAWIAWTFENYSENKGVVGIDYLELPFGWQYCDVVRSTIWNSTASDTMQSAYEWYNEEGLMKVEYSYAKIFLYDDYGVIIDSANVYYYWDLIDYDIQP